MHRSCPEVRRWGVEETEECGWSTGSRGKSDQVMLVRLGALATHGLSLTFDLTP